MFLFLLSFELFILLLADDVVLLSETVVGLQNQLNNLACGAKRLGLRVNLNKSNIIVFRKGGFLARNEAWTLDGKAMPVVNTCKYLGILFSTKLSFNIACKDLACRGKKPLVQIMRKLFLLNNNSLDVFLKLFDAQIVPIFSYEAEIWGLENAANNCEKIHNFALKKILGLDRRTPNDLVYSETNRYPVTLNCIVKCIRYWLKLVVMNENRLPHKAYLMLYRLDINGKVNWVSNVRKCLFQHGFGYVWLSET